MEPVFRISMTDVPWNGAGHGWTSRALDTVEARRWKFLCKPISLRS